MYHIFFICCFVDGHLGFFHVLAIVNSAAVNIEGHVSFWIVIFSRYMPSSDFVIFNSKIISSYKTMVAQSVKNLPAMRETWVHSLCWEDPLEKSMATHSSPLAWSIPRAEEPGYSPWDDWVTNTFTSFKSKLKICCCSVAKSCSTLATPWTAACQASLSFTITQSLLKLISTELVKPSSVTPFSSSPQSYPASESFPMSWLLASGGQSIGASASASVLPMNIQGWFPLGLTDLISLQSKGLSRVFSKPHFENINSSVLTLLYGPTLISIYDYWKNHQFWLHGPLSGK